MPIGWAGVNHMVGLYTDVRNRSHTRVPHTLPRQKLALVSFTVMASHILVFVTGIFDASAVGVV